MENQLNDFKYKWNIGGRNEEDKKFGIPRIDLMGVSKTNYTQDLKVYDKLVGKYFNFDIAYEGVNGDTLYPIKRSITLLAV